MYMTKETKKKNMAGAVRRRDFIIESGAVIVGGAVGAIGGPNLFPKESMDGKPIEVIQEVAKQAPIDFPVAKGYLVVDQSECAQCYSCMMACSLVHEGRESFSLSRIQITGQSFGIDPPKHTTPQVCRQCVTPFCVEACPTGACHINAANGNIRLINEAECIGCQHCLQACPFIPHRIIWNHEKKKCTKCDLCIHARYGDGKPACVAVCPADAIKLVDQVPDQTDDVGYKVDLYEETADRRGWK
jgi:Fe-S-cluster-containing dehydrogenase component